MSRRYTSLSPVKQVGARQTLVEAMGLEGGGGRDGVRSVFVYLLFSSTQRNRGVFWSFLQEVDERAEE